MRNPNASHGKSHDHWRNLLRPPSRCGFRNQDTTSSCFSPSSACANAHKAKQKRHESACGESSLTNDEFSDFMNFLADEDVLDSLQNIVEDAVQKLRDVTTEDGEHLFDIVEDSCSSTGSASWSVSYSHRHTDSSSTYSHSHYYTTTATSSSDEDQKRQFQSQEKQKPARKVCLLDKFVSRLAKPEKKKVSGGFHAETISERSGDTYYFLQEHFHIWAKLAESFHQLPKKDYFSKFKKLPKQEHSKSLHKEITNVLKRPTPSTLLLYSAGQEPFQSLDFLEENGILAALQDIINEAVQKVLEATLGDGAPLFDIFGDEGQLSVPWESSMGGSEEEGEQGGDEDDMEGSGSGEEGSVGETDDESTPGQKKKRRKGRRKKKGGEAAAEEGKGKQKYTPPPLPKSKRKSLPQEEPQRKPKYVPPPLPKSKPRPPPEEPPPKPKYTPPPLPKPKKKQEAIQTEAEEKKIGRHIITTKDIKRARLQARPLPKQAIIDFLIENAAKLIIYKYNYETVLSEKLGFISVPVTKVLLEIMFGYKRIKGSGIRLSSQIDWTKVNEEIYAPRPSKPKTLKLKAGNKKKAGDKKKKNPVNKMKPGDTRKSVAFKPEMPTGKVVVTVMPTEKKEVKVSKPKGRPSSAEKEGRKQTEITEILPPRFPQEFTKKEGSKAEEAVQPLDKEPSKRSFSITDESSRRSIVSQKSLISKDSSTKLPGVTLEDEGPLPTPKESILSQRLYGETYDSKRGSTTSVLPEVEPTSQPSIESLKNNSFSRKASVNGESSRKSSTVFPKI